MALIPDLFNFIGDRLEPDIDSDVTPRGASEVYGIASRLSVENYLNTLRRDMITPVPPPEPLFDLTKHFPYNDASFNLRTIWDDEGYHHICNIMKNGIKYWKEAIELLGYDSIIEIKDKAYSQNGIEITNCRALVCKKEDNEKINISKLFELEQALKETDEIDYNNLTIHQFVKIGKQRGYTSSELSAKWRKGERSFNDI